jgi:hypothetical protein
MFQTKWLSQSSNPGLALTHEFDARRFPETIYSTNFYLVALFRKTFAANSLTSLGSGQWYGKHGASPS